jgi:hypothetical protein
MSKKYYLLFVLALTLCQTIVHGRNDRVTTFRPPSDWKGNIQYQEVIEAPDAKASALFAKAKEWCAKTFVGVGDGSLSEDSAAGVLTFRGSVTASWRRGSKTQEQAVLFTVTVEVIEGRSRVTFSGFMLDNCVPAKTGDAAGEQKWVPMESCIDREGFPQNDATEKFFLRVHEQIKDLIESAKKALEK